MSLIRAAATVSSFTLLSRITGLARDIVIARAFGAGSLTDAFWVAFRIPNLLRRLFAEGAFAQAFVPILGEVKTRNEQDTVQLVLDRVALSLFFALLIVTVVGIIGAPWVVLTMASGLSEPARQNDFISAVWMTRMMFPYIICMSLIAFASGVLNTWKKFAIPAFTPVLLNLSMIAASMLLTPYLAQPIYALAIGVMFGGIAQLAVQWFALARMGLRPRMSLRIREALTDPIVRRIMRQMLPATLGVSVAQISLLINTNIATWLAPGSVTWLSFADRLMEFPTALLGVALGTVLLPSLSRANASESTTAYSALLDWGLRLVLLLGMPAALCMVLMADGMVATLFNYGAFVAKDVEQTRLAVMAYSAGLVGLLMVKILAPGFYGRQDIRTPVKIAIVVLILTQLLNLVLVPWLAHAGLALAIGLGGGINATLLLLGLLRKNIYRPAPGWGKFLLRQLFGLALMSIPLLAANHYLDWIALQSTPFHRVMMLGLVLSGSMLLYISTLFALGVRVSDFKRNSGSNKVGKTEG
ncbi:murein biosynthesis integral membrane protein MurJ [Orrella sp. NBD-18]|uniref:Probable lipid II flippase MurJ n=1 Tax=Sheuella amnicola TaxID=2707330 RepID=A0A6B2QUB5_9BURK|nr:murein biosynthesis integral membrane protein MurJ [Sheuella amnicola]NDY81702.1 murein biosynthesis integral membrane protein MurJ [Sheuella amnicola]